MADLINFDLDENPCELGSNRFDFHLCNMLTGQQKHIINIILFITFFSKLILEINGIEHYLNIESPIGYGRAYSARSKSSTSTHLWLV